jgi:anthranilate/para-aminobenzoate synthase component I
MTTPARPQHRALRQTPEEVAASLRHLPGFVWLDTSGRSPEADRDHAASLMAACPLRVLTGHLSDPAPLEEALSSLTGNAPPAADWGLPLHGLIGTVDYDGHYCFGLYNEVIIYRHRSEEWFETGDLLSLARPAEELPVMPALEFSRETKEEAFCGMVERAQEYIRSGDIYQVNLAHRFQAPWPDGADPFALYLRLREASPVPCAAYIAQAGRTVLSSSPESFLRMSAGGIRTRPVKGTRPRFADPVADERSLRELITSPKERAELVMITDLLRNDLGMVCEYGSVRVTGLLQPESYEQVHHLVSTVQGTLRPDISHVRALAACFPGGSITGAPKRRAMEIIRELEPCPRGLYTGAIGFLGANGESHFNIAIRTVTVESGAAFFHAGAGIVADSVPAMEWEETMHKAAGMLEASGCAGNFKLPTSNIKEASGLKHQGL